jgi:hypothetical protein
MEQNGGDTIKSPTPLSPEKESGRSTPVCVGKPLKTFIPKTPIYVDPI